MGIFFLSKCGNCNGLYNLYVARTSTAAQSDPWGFGALWGYQTAAEPGLLLLISRYYDPAP